MKVKDSYSKMKHIYQKGYYPFVVRFVKVTFYHVAFETLISVYILELFATLSKFFLTDPTSISKMHLLVFFPALITIPSSLLYGIFCAIYFAEKVCVYSDKFSESTCTKLEYSNILKEYRKEVVLVHFAGVIFYVASTIIIPIVLIHIYPEKFADPLSLAIFIPIMGTILGLSWNVTGIFRNQRLVWHKLLTSLAEADIIEDVKENNYHYLIKNIAGNLISVVILFVMLAVMVFNIHPNLLVDEVFKSLTTDYSFLVLSFIALVVLYLKVVLPLIYLSDNEDEMIYPSLTTILSYGNIS